MNVPDFVGCGRCVTSCPKGVLKFPDVRGLFKKPTPSDKQVGERSSEDKQVLIPAPVGRTIEKLDSAIDGFQGAVRSEVVEIDQRDKKALDQDQNVLELKNAKGGKS